MIEKKMWVEVFDIYFGQKKKQFSNKKNNQIPDSIKDVISKIQEMSDESMSPDQIDQMFEDKMGVANEIIEYTEGNIHYTKKVWNQDGGKFVRIIAKVAEGVKYEDLSLDEKLRIAIQNEDYEKAASLRDEITTPKVKISGRAKELVEEGKKILKKIKEEKVEKEPVKRKRRKKE